MRLPKSIPSNLISIFFLQGIIFIPLHLFLIPSQSNWANFLFGGLIEALATAFNLELHNSSISSDSTSLYLLLVILLIVSFLISAGLQFSKWWKRNQPTINGLLNTVFVFYLSFRLLSYGWDKVFKSQFYLPEPNLLYTPLGQFSKDILYWSTIGSSHAYNLFTGSFECLAALLLIFRKTRPLGLILSLATFIQIVFINFSFDISVKVLSLFLLVLILWVGWPVWKALFQLLVKRDIIQFRPGPGVTVGSRSLQLGLTVFTIGFILIESVYPYWQTRSFNDDFQQRPYLHGAYRVLRATPQRDSLAVDIPVKRFFIHRSGYIIFQDERDHFTDYRLKVDSANSKFYLTDYSLNTTVLKFHYQTSDSVLTFNYPLAKGKQGVRLKAKALDWRALPLLKNDFHWTVDGY